MVSSEHELARALDEQGVTMLGGYRQPPFAIQIELNCPLKHPLTPIQYTHKNPLFTTPRHYIEKNTGGQAEKQIFSLRDKELARAVKAE